MRARYSLPVYGEYVRDVIRPAKASAEKHLKHWRFEEDYWRGYQGHRSAAFPTPVQDIRLRIKRPESVIDKIHRLPQKFPQGVAPASLYAMRDVLGARIVTFFQSHLRMVDEEIRSGGHFEIAPEYPPRSYIDSQTMIEIGLDTGEFQVRGQKPSGYASLHYVVREAGDHPGPWFELQVRTMLEQVWGEVEHQLGYKPEEPMDHEARNQFWILAQYLDTIDSHFNVLYRHALNRQSESRPRPEDEITPENLPRVINHFDYGIAQREISPLSEILKLRGISHVHQLWDRGKREIVQAIAATYQRSGKFADGFALVAVLAELPDDPSTSDAVRVTQTHILLTLSTHESRQPTEAKAD